ncbi:hypothetical protein A9Q74_11980 [Colwellia sp. 39_35_sub15_T18]|nr:hypothetical protein A9Q74_11980 [Colwellia sp. 39_35_sub15_T18]
MTNNLMTENNEPLFNDLAVNNDSVSNQDKLILLIENDQLLSNALQQRMQASGYQVVPKSRDKSIEQSLTGMQADMVILDIGFSDLSSLSVINKIRHYFKGPLVVLTSRDSEQEQITAFNLGVDEYLVKPLSANIFSVRVTALFKHYVKAQTINEDNQVCVGDLTLYPISHKCQVGQHAIVLTQFEFKLLRLLAENKGKIMTRDYIYQSLLGREYNGSERTVDVRVSKLREKLTIEGQQQIHIETIWGQGYMLNVVE